MRGLQDNVKNINEENVGEIDLRTLLTTLVENLHAVSHFKNEFSQLCSMHKTLARFPRNL